MAETPSTMVSLGTAAPAFRLPDPAGKFVSSDDFMSAPALLVAFICNHCPFVKHIRSQFAEFARDAQARGVAVVAINSNDVTTNPDDSRPSNGRPVTGKDLRAAIAAVLAGKPVSVEQKPSVGCNIKWKSRAATRYAH